MAKVLDKTPALCEPEPETFNAEITAFVASKKRGRTKDEIMRRFGLTPYTWQKESSARIKHGIWIRRRVDTITYYADARYREHTEKLTAEIRRFNKWKYNRRRRQSARQNI